MNQEKTNQDRAMQIGKLYAELSEMKKNNSDLLTERMSRLLDKVSTLQSTFVSNMKNMQQLQAILKETETAQIQIDSKITVLMEELEEEYNQIPKEKVEDYITKLSEHMTDQNIIDDHLEAVDN